jgi:hypothetical protein
MDVNKHHSQRLQAALHEDVDLLINSFFLQVWPALAETLSMLSVKMICINSNSLNASGYSLQQALQLGDIQACVDTAALLISA